jgi:hypothetical protein
VVTSAAFSHTPLLTAPARLHGGHPITQQHPSKEEETQMSFVRQAVASGTALLAVLLSPLTASPASAATGASTARAAGETLVLNTVGYTGHAVSLYYGSSTNGAPIQVWNYQGQPGTNQQWEVVPEPNGDWFRLKNKAGGTCITVQQPHGEDLVKLVGWACTTSYAQLWTRVPIAGTNEFTLVNRYSGKCMDQTVNGGGQQMVQWRCHGQAHQRFTATAV